MKGFARPLLIGVSLTACVAAAQDRPREPRSGDISGGAMHAVPLSTGQKSALEEALAKHNYEAAETVLVNAINKSPRSDELLVTAGRVFLADHKPLNSAIALKRADHIHPLQPPDRFALAMAYIGIGKGSWAKPELERLAAAEPKEVKYPYWLSRIDYDARNYASAVSRLRAVTAADPAFLKGWDNLGLSLEGLGQLREAVMSYRRAVELNRTQSPPSPWPLLNLGTLLTKMGTLEEGRGYLKDALELDPAMAQGHCRLGQNYHRDHRDNEAVLELTKCAELDVADPDPHYTLAQIYRDQGKASEADAAFQAFQALKDKRRSPAP